VTLLELAGRCERATGPDRELDTEIGKAVEAEPFAICDYGNVPVFASFTASLDAAMTLVPEGLKWGIGNPQDGYSYATMGNLPRAVRAATPALALCAASLRARATQGSTAR
jgi:hypothetical protein